MATKSKALVLVLLLATVAAAQISNPSTVSVVTTPWSTNWLLNTNAADGLSDLGYSAFVSPTVDDADLATFLATLGVGAPFAALSDDANNVEAAATLDTDGWLDVRWFGAVGDGVTDVSAAIQATIDAAEASGQGVFIPAGDWLLGAPLVPHSGLSVAGLPAQTNLHIRDAGEAAFDTASIAANIERVHLRGLTFRGDAAGCYGFKASDPNYYVAYSSFVDCEFYAELHTAIWATMGRCKIESCRFGYLGTPATYHRAICGDGLATQVAFTNVIINSAFYYGEGADAAVEFDFGNSLEFIGCVWEAMDCPAVELKGILSAEFRSCNFEKIDPNGGTGVVVLAKDSDATNGTYATFTNCKVQNNATTPWTVFAKTTTACSVGFANCYIMAANGDLLSDGTNAERRDHLHLWRQNRVISYDGDLGAYTRQMQGMVDRAPTAETASRTLSAYADEGKHFTNTGAAGSIILTLPDLSIVGWTARFTRTASYALSIDPNPSDNFSGYAAGKYIQLDTDGDSVTIQCISDGVIAIIGVHGTLTYQP